MSECHIIRKADLQAGGQRKVAQRPVLGLRRNLIVDFLSGLRAGIRTFALRGCVIDTRRSEYQHDEKEQDPQIHGEKDVTPSIP